MAANPIPMISEGVAFASLSKQAKERVIKEVARKAAAMFKAKKDALVNAFNYKEMVSSDRYEFYKGRTAQQWAELKQTFPEEYSKQIRDFYILERRISAGQTRARVAGQTGEEEQYEVPSNRTGV